MKTINYLLRGGLMGIAVIVVILAIRNLSGFITLKYYIGSIFSSMVMLCLPAFITGSIVGLIYGKIKNRKQVGVTIK